ncbi:thioesterase-like superfamily-domain-containing protein [Chaetomidium leptoderma]|uniref:Thioesterase-like superfamily-domain-containing protein n=1 Tax=Chaetomidium leptoderma TaxID=669021 RepID=A0AAN6VKW2_9PEZI|nr:thioesterase-like superfamily-domain-containing protein [Chaetomidium leptoderma]
MDDRPTLLRPPPNDPNKTPIENALEVTELAVLGPNIFTNTRQPWHPPGARGIYGGAVIAMCLAAAQRTVAANFLVHSCHCYFLLAGASELPILFHVEQVRDGRSFATRTVQARQRGRCIFTTTISFVRDSSTTTTTTTSSEVSHASEIPKDAAGRPLQPPPDDYADEPELLAEGPFQGTKIEVVDGGTSGKPGEKKTRQWVRARGTIRGGQAAQLEALAYVSDSYFIGTITRIHRLWRFPFRAEEYDDLPEDARAKVKALHQWEGMGDDPREMVGRPAIGMMVSLDHTIYFHEPGRVRADEWMLTEMESPWAADGRGVVMQKIYSKDGTLLATCVQEGLVRLQQPTPEGKESKL